MRVFPKIFGPVGPRLSSQPSWVLGSNSPGKKHRFFLKSFQFTGFFRKNPVNLSGKKTMLSIRDKGAKCIRFQGSECSIIEIVKTKIYSIEEVCRVEVGAFPVATGFECGNLRPVSVGNNNRDRNNVKITKNN